MTSEQRRDDLARSLTRAVRTLLKNGAPPRDLIMILLTVADVTARENGQLEYLAESWAAVQRQALVLDAEEAEAAERLGANLLGAER